MATAICAACKNRVEEGAVRCVNCDAPLYMPGTFTQVVGCVVAAISLIPFSIAEVTTGERDLVPLVLGAVVLGTGVILFFTGRAKNKAAPNRVIEQPDGAATSTQP